MGLSYAQEFGCLYDTGGTDEKVVRPVAREAIRIYSRAR
jgi:hypothetical protein